MKANNQYCPCGNLQNNLKLPYNACCEPFIKGTKKPKTALELLRSRYTAFAVGAIDYILKTHHSKTVGEIKPEEVKEWSLQSEWLGLEVLQTQNGLEKDEKGTITFKATYKDKTASGEPKEHLEHALFEKENGEWKFLDAQGVRTGTYVREEPKIGRNDPCPCGSGKKYKKCCG